MDVYSQIPYVNLWRKRASPHRQPCLFLSIFQAAGDHRNIKMFKMPYLSSLHSLLAATPFVSFTDQALCTSSLSTSSSLHLALFPPSLISSISLDKTHLEVAFKHFTHHRGHPTTPLSPWISFQSPMSFTSSRSVIFSSRELSRLTSHRRIQLTGSKHQLRGRFVHLLLRLWCVDTPRLGSALSGLRANVATDQGMMGGVNGAVDYYYNTMKFGHPEADGPHYDNTLLQGGIVCPSPRLVVEGLFLTGRRSRSTTSVPSSAVSLVDGLAIAMVGSRRLPLALPGLFSAHVSKPPLRITSG